MIKTQIVDEGIYMFQPNDNSGRWVIRHPFKSYSPNESNMFDVYVEHPFDPNREPIIDLGSFETLMEAKVFIEKTHNANKSYFNLKSA